ncbi:hypothetical protein [Nocardioides acrostichi]|uniref:Uncharacterized protein n=1 Tax=Nocardioides acrostichi TaxID=2784339 RepID=A0A930Y7I1_9ACTN|nr:hypothetical protein [Nocardioides acrostichi]MBF4163445.1 hypothetical protein [Nocardioides acrostichi]
MRCTQCGTKIRGDETTTWSGSTLCGSCGDIYNGAALGMMTGGGMGAKLTDAVASAGVFGWMRRWRESRTR